MRGVVSIGGGGLSFIGDGGEREEGLRRFQKLQCGV
jgi:hypothetical protein